MPVRWHDKRVSITSQLIAICLIALRFMSALRNRRVIMYVMLEGLLRLLRVIESSAASVICAFAGE